MDTNATYGILQSSWTSLQSLVDKEGDGSFIP